MLAWLVKRSLKNHIQVRNCMLVYDFHLQNSFHTLNQLHTIFIKPYQREGAIANNIKAVFNYQKCHACRTSENAFGIFVQVFRILYTLTSVNPRTVNNVIIVCCYLHNILREGYLANTGRANYDPTQKLPTHNLLPLRRTGGYTNAQELTLKNTYASYFIVKGKVSQQDIRVHRTEGHVC